MKKFLIALCVLSLVLVSPLQAQFFSFGPTGPNPLSPGFKLADGQVVPHMPQRMQCMNFATFDEKFKKKMKLKLYIHETVKLPVQGAPGSMRTLSDTVWTNGSQLFIFTMSDSVACYRYKITTHYINRDAEPIMVGEEKT